MARRVKQPLSEADAFLTKYIDSNLSYNTGKSAWSSEEVTGMVQEVMKRFLERCLKAKWIFISKRRNCSCLKRSQG